MRRPLILTVPILLALMAAKSLFAHEFWIEPRSFQAEKGEILQAHLVNGQNFNGGALSWFEYRIERTEFSLGDDVFQITGRDGDQPALRMTPEGEGLLKVIHQTKPSKLTYQDPEKFQAFVSHKDLDTTALPDPTYPLIEGYTRYAKSLLAVGTGDGADSNSGLLTEFVALKNPYRDDISGGLPLRLMYKGQPRANAQVEVFERAPDDTVDIKLYRTDQNGEVTLPVKPGYDYLIDAVVLRRPTSAIATEQGWHWESLWASLTFGVPE
ncbi:DUF4198 domain-containing protein [Cognatishimia maritima]|uniref:Uncharacterized conserved protein, contains GH25 family domain n=1 Tax=Cognatishimia maritima TaxID=870908 RepID=A0A1M5IEC3_9RHOB|nr:DUF4198 domain-containing protein [Cognatishimia maritima]SHG26133.1 Uncharacterized conserved protein, contains GH25 family domain [Cognatishimia maritima]